MVQNTPFLHPAQGPYPDSPQEPDIRDWLPNPQNFDDFHAFESEVLKCASRLNNRLQNAILPVPVSLFHRRPVKPPVFVRKPGSSAELRVTGWVLDELTRACVTGTPPPSFQENFPPGSLWRDSWWSEQCVRPPPEPEMFDCEADFAAATDLWYQRTVEAARELRHPQSLVSTFGGPVVRPQRRSVYEPQTRTRIRSRFREVRRGRQSRRVSTFAESELIQFAVRDRSVTTETEEKVKRLMQAPLREVDCDIAKRFEGVTLTEPLTQVRAAMDGWCVQKMPWNMRMKAMAVLDASDRVELDFSSNARFLRCLVRTAQSKTYSQRFAFYLKFTERLDENMEMVFRLARSEIGVLCLVTGMIAEFSPISCVMFDPMLDELEMFSGEDGDKGLLEYTHWVLHYFEYIIMWETMFYYNVRVKEKLVEHRNMCHELAAPLFVTRSRQLRTILLSSQQYKLTAALIRIMMNIDVPEVNAFLCDCGSDFFVMLNRIGAHVPKYLNAIILWMTQTPRVVPFIFARFTEFACNPPTEEFSHAFLSFLHVLLLMNIQSTVAVSWVLPFFKCLYWRDNHVLLCDLCTFIVRHQPEHIQSDMQQCLGLLQFRCFGDNPPHVDHLIAFSTCLESPYAEQFLEASITSLVSIFQFTDSHSEPMSLAAWDVVKSLALYHTTRFARCLRHQHSWFGQFVASLKTLRPRPCLVLVEVCVILSERADTCPRKKNRARKALKHINRAFRQASLDLVAKTQWALEFLHGTEFQKAQNLYNRLIERRFGCADPFLFV